ncbi:MAG: TetR/AcrR family transcriptional regulator, partial [Pseudomonadota bacterium]
MVQASKASPLRARVIDVATTLFWRHGYDGVSVGDLVEATGANRYALYAEFGDKRAVYLAVLQRYIDDAVEMIEEMLARPDADPVVVGPLSLLMGCAIDGLTATVLVAPDDHSFAT